MRQLAALALVLVALCALLLVTIGRSRGPASVEGAGSGALAPDRGAELAATAREARSPHGRPPPAKPASAEQGARAAAAPTTAIAGRVLFADGSPAAEASVGLFAPAEQEDGPQSPFAAAELRPRTYLRTLRFVRAWTATDAEGRFRLEDVEPGTWLVRADLSPLLAAATEPFPLQAGAAREDLEVRLPPAAWVTGHVLAPAGADFESLCLELRVHGEGSLGPWVQDNGRPVNGVLGTVDSAWRFRLGPVETGLCTLGVSLDGGLRARGRPEANAGQFVPVLDAYLGPGDTERDLDLRAGFPGALRVTVRLSDPTALPGARRPCNLVAESVDRADGPLYASVRGAWDKPIESGPLAPGLWNVAAMLPQLGPWLYGAPLPVLVEPARTTEVTIDVEVARGSLFVRDLATGAPLPDTWLEVGLRGADGGLTVGARITDERGRLDTVLPPGRYLVTARDEGIDTEATGDADCAVLVWTVGGPALTSITVPR